MANLSEEAKEYINKNKKKLQNDDLDSFYKGITDRDMKKEITEFFIEVGVPFLDNMTSIPREMLYGSTEVKELTIPGNIEKIGYSAFTFSNIERVILSEGVEMIDQAAFHSSQLREIELGSVKIIKKGAFSDTRLTKVYLPDTVSMIGPNVWPEDCILISGPRKRNSLRFPKNEYQWYKEHLILQRPEPETVEAEEVEV